LVLSASNSERGSGIEITIEKVVSYFYLDTFTTGMLFSREITNTGKYFGIRVGHW